MAVIGCGYVLLLALPVVVMYSMYYDVTPQDTNVVRNETVLFDVIHVLMVLLYILPMVCWILWAVYQSICAVLQLVRHYCCCCFCLIYTAATNIDNDNVMIRSTGGLRRSGSSNRSNASTTKPADLKDDDLDDIEKQQQMVASSSSCTITTDDNDSTDPCEGDYDDKRSRNRQRRKLWRALRNQLFFLIARCGVLLGIYMLFLVTCIFQYAVFEGFVLASAMALCWYITLFRL